MALQSASPPRSWSVSSSKPGATIPTGYSPAQMIQWLEPKCMDLTKYVWLPQRANHEVLLFMGSTACVALIQKCQAFQKLTFPYTSKSPSLFKDTAKCQSSTFLANTAFEPTLNLNPTIKLPAFKVYRFQLTSQTFGDQRRVRSHFKMTFAWGVQPPKRMCPKSPFQNCSPNSNLLIRPSPLMGPFQKSPVHEGSPLSQLLQV